MLRNGRENDWDYWEDQFEEGVRVCSNGFENESKPSPRVRRAQARRVRRSGNPVSPLRGTDYHENRPKAARLRHSRRKVRPPETRRRPNCSRALNKPEEKREAKNDSEIEKNLSKSGRRRKIEKSHRKIKMTTKKGEKTPKTQREFSKKLKTAKKSTRRRKKVEAQSEKAQTRETFLSRATNLVSKLFSKGEISRKTEFGKSFGTKNGSRHLKGAKEYQKMNRNGLNGRDKDGRARGKTREKDAQNGAKLENEKKRIKRYVNSVITGIKSQSVLDAIFEMFKEVDFAGVLPEDKQNCDKEEKICSLERKVRESKERIAMLKSDKKQKESAISRIQETAEMYKNEAETLEALNSRLAKENEIIKKMNSPQTNARACLGRASERNSEPQPSHEAQSSEGGRKQQEPEARQRPKGELHAKEGNGPLRKRVNKKQLWYLKQIQDWKDENADFNEITVREAKETIKEAWRDMTLFERKKALEGL